MTSIELVKWQERPARTRGALPKIRGSPYPNRVAPLLPPKPPRGVPRLPNEIIHLIIESLDNIYDRPTLARLCLVSKDLLLASRKTLYAEIKIEQSSGAIGKTSTRLLNNLMLHPHLAARVRQIRLELDDDDDPFRPPLAPGEVSLESYLEALLPTCTAVEDLAVDVFWATDDSAARRILGALASIASSLKSLYVNVISRLSVDDEVSALFQLARHLTTSHCYGLFTLVGAPPTFELEELNASDTCLRQNFDILTRFSTSSLHTLRVTPKRGHSGQSESHKLDLPSFPNLHTLRICTSCEQAEADQIFSNISSLHLHHLDFRVYLEHNRRLGYLHIPPDLPATLTHLRLDVPTIKDITLFLDSGSCPLISSATFELEVKPNPWTRIALAGAAKERGLRMIRDEPMWDAEFEEDMAYDRVQRRQMLLKEFWS